VLEAFAVSHGKASPYFPIIELLKTYFEIEPQDDERKRGEKVTGKVLMLDGCGSHSEQVVRRQYGRPCVAGVTSAASPSPSGH